jgi:hypothetical protein
MPLNPDVFRPAVDDDVVASLSECHARMRTFLEGMVRIAGLDDLGDPRVAPTAARCARYFREAFPLHGRDEDESVAPRLRAHAAGAGVVDALARATEEHGVMDEELTRILPVLEALAGGGTPVRTDAFRADVASFSARLTAHLALEEAVVLPAIAALPAPVRAAVRSEMRARRQ